MDQSYARDPFGDNPFEAIPGELGGLLASAPQRPKPAFADLGSVSIESTAVAGDAKVLYGTPNHRSDIATLVRHGDGTVVHQPGSDLLELLALSFGDCRAPDREAAIASPADADVGEAQKVEALRFALTAGFAVAACKAAKLDEAGLLRVQLQAESLQPFAQLPPEPLSFASVLKTGHHIVRVTDEVDFPPGSASAPLMGPLVQAVPRNSGS